MRGCPDNPRNALFPVSVALYLATACVVLSFPVFGTELKPATAQAFQGYVQEAEEQMQSEVDNPYQFLYIDALPEGQKAAVIGRLKNGEVVIQPMTTNGHETPTQVPGGLIHHWLAIGFIPGVGASQVLQLWQDYSRYGELYKPDVQSAQILSRQGEDFDVYYRLYRHTIVSVVYNADFEVEYFIPDATRRETTVWHVQPA